MLVSILTLGISDTPCDYFWNDLLFILKVRIAFKFIFTGVTCTSPRWNGYDSSLSLPF